jgi:mannitol/fructose-specific phosphotransferase system IIA component (Ntr-type)
VDGTTVVVLDTRRAVSQAVSEPVREMEPRPPRSVRPSVRLAGLLSEKNVLLWDAPVWKGDALAALVSKAVPAEGHPNMAEALSAVLGRESQGTTFFPGLALPHARLEGLSAPLAALGVTKGGIAGEPEGQETHLVVLTLTPESAPEVQVDLLAQASRAASDPVFAQRIKETTSGADAVALWKAWEEGRI